MSDRLAVIVPYRDRAQHLAEFTRGFPQAFAELSPPIDYAIFIIEQTPERLFNRGELLNVGFALTQDKFDFFCFHDVDMVPIHVDYSYPKCPTHLAATLQFDENPAQGLPYPNYFGGVVLFNKKDFIKVNGFSNRYWGYGAEDDDLFYRIKKMGLRWERRDCAFKALAHSYGGDTLVHAFNAARLHEIKQKKQADTSGLSTLRFTVKSETHFPSYTLFLVDI